MHKPVGLPYDSSATAFIPGPHDIAYCSNGSPILDMNNDIRSPLSGYFRLNSKSIYDSTHCHIFINLTKCRAVNKTTSRTTMLKLRDGLYWLSISILPILTSVYCQRTYWVSMLYHLISKRTARRSESVFNSCQKKWKWSNKNCHLRLNLNPVQHAIIYSAVGQIIQLNVQDKCW